MSLASAFGAPVVLRLESGGDVTFPKLKMKKIAELCEKLSAAREVRNRKRAKEAGLTGDNLARFMAVNDNLEVNVFDLYDWALTPKGTEAILTESLGAEKSQEVLDSLPAEMGAVIAKRVLGWVPVEDKQTENPTENENSTGSETDGSSPNSTV